MTINPKIGQVWIDNDPRNYKYSGYEITKTIIDIKYDYAICEGRRSGQSTVISKSKIRLDRFNPNSNRGYKLLK